jgi:hypothetical protein
MIRKTIVTGAAVLALALASAGVGASPAGAQADQSAPTVVGHVRWEGRELGTSAYELPIMLTLEKDGQLIDLPITDTDNQGYFKLEMDGIAPENYKYVVRGVRYLSNSGELKIEADAEVIQVEMGLMRAGDCNRDNVVNAQDFSIVKNSFGKALGDEGYDVRADLNGDSIVSSRDFSLLRGNFGMAGDE